VNIGDFIVAALSFYVPDLMEVLYHVALGVTVCSLCRAVFVVRRAGSLHYLMQLKFINVHYSFWSVFIGV
jgi:hypothetical protein